MRAFLLAFALSLSLPACADSAEQNAVDEGAPAGDQEDVIGDGEIIDEPGEPEGNVMDGTMADSTGTAMGTDAMADSAGTSM